MFRKLETVVPPSESVVGSSNDQNTLFNCSGEVGECKVVEIHFDPLVMHTISLLQYKRKMNCYRVRMGPPPSLPVFNPIKLNLPNSEDMANEFSEENVQMLLRKAVAVLAAHLGFVSRNGIVCGISHITYCCYENKTNVFEFESFASSTIRRQRNGIPVSTNACASLGEYQECNRTTGIL